jgi:hypothetical protein
MFFLFFVLNLDVHLKDPNQSLPLDNSRAGIGIIPPAHDVDAFIQLRQQVHTNRSVSVVPRLFVHHNRKELHLEQLDQLKHKTTTRSTLLNLIYHDRHNEEGRGGKEKTTTNRAMK